MAASKQKISQKRPLLLLHKLNGWIVILKAPLDPQGSNDLKNLTKLGIVLYKIDNYIFRLNTASGNIISP